MKRPWLKLAVFLVPAVAATLYLVWRFSPEQAVIRRADALFASLEKHAALIFRIWSAERPVQTTIGAVHDQGRRLAGGLSAAGIGPGDVLAFQLPNWAEAAATFFAASMLGVVIVPIVHYYGVKELGFALGESRARALITSDRFRRTDYVANLEAVRPSLPELELVVMLSLIGFSLDSR